MDIVPVDLESLPGNAPARKRKLLAESLLCSLNEANAVKDQARCDLSLDHLRRLARTHPEDAPVREHLAKALLNTLNDASAEND